jgi:hypothetical protein
MIRKAIPDLCLFSPIGIYRQEKGGNNCADFIDIAAIQIDVWMWFIR